MTAYVFYTPDNGPEERKVKEFMRELEINKVDTKLIEFESREGIGQRDLYDVMSHPALVLVRLDGSMVAKWQDELPLVTEVSYLAHRT